jgi:UDPglucose--hexose-1-phosphate uridylyltransferase
MADNPRSVREIRINPVLPSESVLVATARGMRPRKAEEKIERNTASHVDKCPFCTGNEAMTPPTLAQWPAGGEWAIRDVENLYPVLGESDSTSHLVFGLQQVIDGYGRHEVLIDHPNHGISIHEMSTEHLAMLFGAYRDRMRALYESNPRIGYVLVFKNFGPAAGASIPHTHSQIIATPVVPENVYNEVEYARQYHARHHECIYCSLINEALTFEATIYDRDSGEVQRKINVGQYIIERGERFIAIKPFASRFEWEVHILPLSHQADFTALGDKDREDLARVLKRTMTRLEAVIGGAQYNYFLHSLPHGEQYANDSASYHWHLEICPRTSIPTGFELGSGLFVSTISPEDAAQQLRDVDI